ncbi:MAG: hypothetical protein MUO26_03035 [Methanotrichaceae archaeon]|nr:hypothetical protein [Methanotrichaceae archaeon]
MPVNYGFLIYIDRIKSAYDRFELIIWVLNTIIISIFFYAIFLLLGLPAFARFYWQGFLPFEYSPAIISLIIGTLISTIIKRKKTGNIFVLLGPELSEKAKTAYDNREIRSILMESLAHDVEVALAKIDPSKILNWLKLRNRLVLIVLLLLLTVIITQSQISADITPADFQSLSDLRDRASGILQNNKQPQGKEVNLSGNIYGKPSLAILSEEKLELMLYPGLGAGSRARSAEPVNRLFQQAQGVEVSAVPTELYIESLPPQNREIIKRYFELLARG